jgi:hypothetical protein
LPPGATEGWLGAVQQDIARLEYRITSGDPGARSAIYQAPNRAQNFRTHFTPDGIRVVPRAGHRAVAPAWEWGLALAAWGREGDLTQAATPAELHTNANRVEYRRDGLTEWYVNDPRGLEQGFTILRKPAGNDSAPVRVDLSVTGSVTAVLSDTGQAVDFLAPGGARVIRFDHLQVVDSRGRALRSWLETSTTTLGAELLTIFVDDRAAKYPITIDPLATSPAWTSEGDQESALFGLAVATAGDVNGDGYSDVIVGAYAFDRIFEDEGAVFVYYGSAEGPAASPSWTAEGFQEAAYFGVSVATAGDVNADGYSDVIVGASYYEDGPETDEGAAFVFHGSASGLAQQWSWFEDGDYPSGAFGRSVSTAGDVNGDGYSDVIVGSHLYDHGQTNEGRASVYHGSSDGLSPVALWNGTSDQEGTYYGYSVATAGDVNGDGYSDVIVGAFGYDDGQVQIDEGKAYVYHGSADGLPGTVAWTAEGDLDDAGFGVSVSTAGDVDGDGYSDVIVGGELYGPTNTGRAYVYRGSASGLGTGAAWMAEGDQDYAGFGRQVATAGDVNGDGYADVLVGAHTYDSPDADEGRAFIWYGSSDGLGVTGNPANADWTAESDQANAYFGFAAATAGDVNGDGYSDVIVGANSYDSGQTDEGRAYLYLGSGGGLGSSPGWTTVDIGPAARVATAGDVNGDGYSDVIIGSPYRLPGGAAFVYHGSSGGLGMTPAWFVECDQSDAGFGWSVATAGDVNGDGFADVIIGALDYEDGETDEGRAYVYLGSADGLAPSPSWFDEGNQADAYFGSSVATAGDVNGDGYSDVIVGAPNYDNERIDAGRAVVYHGSPSGLATSPDWIAEGGIFGSIVIDRLGDSVSTAGDVNGDGYSDVIVGAPRNFGDALVYHGSAAGLSGSPNWQEHADQGGTLFGSSVATAGDVNGDGYADVIVGARSKTMDR